MDIWQIPCTGCSECLPCPSGIDIPAVFRLYNRYLRGDESALGEYRELSAGAGDCIRCMRCEQKCTGGIGITGMMLEIAEEFL